MAISAMRGDDPRTPSVDTRPSADLERALSRHSSSGHPLSTLTALEALREPQIATFDTSRPRTWRTPVHASFKKIYAQLLGLNPFHNTYLSLYDPLDTVLDKSIAIASALFAVAAGVPLPVIGYIFGKIINEFPPEEHALHERLVQLLGVAAAYFTVTAFYTIGFGLTAEKVSTKLRQKLLKCLLRLDQAYLDTHDIDVNGLLTEKMDTIQAGCSEKVGIFIQAMSYFVAAFVVGFVLNAKLTGILLGSVVPAITVCFVFLSPAISKYSREVSEQVEQANDIVESALGAVKIVQAFDMIGALCQKHLEFLNASTRSSVKKCVFAAMQSGSVYFIAYSANALAFYVGSRIAADGNAGTVYAVVFLILDASFVVGQFAPFLEIFARAASAKGTVQDLIDAGSNLGNSGTYRTSNHKPDLRDKDIVFQEVAFQYPARPTVKILKGVNLTLKSGTFTAMVGTSGGGKSTMVALLLGLYDYSGTIKFGSEDLHLIDSHHLRSQIAVLDQDSTLFSGTIFDNVCYGLIGQNVDEPERTQRCHQALRDANVDFLDNLPNGVHTRLGNKIKLSGGQRQRVCLARALIKRPAVLILDEPTSALDARSEVAVVETVKRIAATGTSVIMVAHRLSTTLDADYVAVMSDGMVVEQGSPRELFAEGTVFRSLLDAQKTNFDTKDEAADDEDLNVTEETRSHDAGVSSASDSDDTNKGIPGSTSNPRVDIGIWTLAGRVCSIAKPDGWIAATGLFASIVGGGILLGHAIIFGNLIELLNTGRDFPGYYSKADFYSLMFFVLALIALASYLTTGSAFGVTSTRFASRLQTQMLHKLLQLDLQWFSEPGRSTHELMAAFTKDPGDLSALSGVALGAIFTSMTSLIGGLILAHVVAWRIAVVLLAAVPVMVLSGYARLHILTVSENHHREAYREATALAAESCRNRRAVTALCIEDHLFDEYRDALHKPYRQIRNFVFYGNTLLSLCFAIQYFIYALAYWWGAKNVRNGNYSTTQFFIVLPALLFSAQSAGYFFSLSPEIARAKTAARSIFTLLNAQPTIMIESFDAYSKGSSASTSLDKLSLGGSSVVPEKKADGHAKLHFSNVSLSYPNSSRASLNNIELTVQRGQTVAMVGPSGAGKSTAMALIERFYDPSEGSLFFDGVDMRDMDVRDLRSQMGLVSQDPDLFSGSVRYNVKLGAPSGGTVTDEDVERACRQCGLHEFIISLPEGYDTECGSSSSSRLSGGQRQRLAIARALVRNPEVLLLDEPTSALDAHSEAHVQATLADAAKGRTTVMVAHRLASIQHVDRIFVFDQGRLVEQGTHADLVQQGGLYASMAKAQSLA